jgi:hypothetical protein
MGIFLRETGLGGNVVAAVAVTVRRDEVLAVFLSEGPAKLDVDDGVAVRVDDGTNVRHDRVVVDLAVVGDVADALPYHDPVSGAVRVRWPAAHV